MRKSSRRSVEQDHLRKLRAKGVQSDVLDARLVFKEADGFHRYAKIMLDQERIYPNMLPTAQASGRWSITDPPLNNFPPSLDDAIMPDIGSYWLSFDWKSIELILTAAQCGDRDMLHAYEQGHELHSLTTCLIFTHKRPMNLIDPFADIEWCNSWQPVWVGKNDRRRRLAKIASYAMIYGLNEHAMLSAKDIEKLGLSRGELLAAGRAYLASKPALVAWKNKTWTECAEQGVSYTFLGRRRRLYGDYMTRAKTGLNHKNQAAVADMMNLCLADILLGHAELGGWLIVNKHDGAILSFPREAPASVSSQGAEHTVEHTLQVCQSIVHREWDIAGQKIRVIADWKLTNDQGHSTTLKTL